MPRIKKNLRGVRARGWKKKEGAFPKGLREELGVVWPGTLKKGGLTGEKDLTHEGI